MNHRGNFSLPWLVHMDMVEIKMIFHFWMLTSKLGINNPITSIITCSRKHTCPIMSLNLLQPLLSNKTPNKKIKL
jgi:hypothetical protein